MPKSQCRKQCDGQPIDELRAVGHFSAMNKHSVTIAGHPTSIRIESIFWDALIRESLLMGLPVNALIAQIDAERAVGAVSSNLASAIRVWLFRRLAGRPDDGPPENSGLNG